MPDPNDPSNDDYDDPDDPFASGYTPPQPGDDKVNPFDPDDPFASGPTDAKPGDEDVNPFEPMEDGLEEDDPPEDDPEEKKPSMQKRVVRKKPRLPGAKGPLEVDSVGDYLEDVDWTEIDSQARQQAEENYPEEKTEPEPPPEPEPEPEPKPKPDSETTFGIFSQDPEPPPDKGKEEKPSTISGDTEPVEDNGYYSTTAQDSIVPVGPPASPKHLQSQKDFNYDFGSQGPSSFDIPGQASTAKEDAVDKAADSINTATGRIVDMLEGLAQVMNNHSNRIAQLEDTLDMESESDVG